MFLKLEISNIQVTRFAAIQFVMIHARTSLMFSSALNIPGTAPQIAPASMPPRRARNHTIQAGTTLVGMLRAIISDAMVPIRYCPGAPILKSPV